ncbi:cobaltochelatase subunit CobT [Hyphomicrobiales bacterium]|nr:cobaltochelatase subunit CobT [Hyphomicrobiales bacterium]
MTNKSSDIDEFKRALTMAMRSISKQDELTVSFGSDKGNLSGLKARLPMPNKNMDSAQINSLRGEADSLALYLAHHKEMIDEKYSPQGQNAKGIYNSLEKVRCDAIGSNSMTGVSNNLVEMEKTKIKRKVLSVNNDSPEGKMIEALSYIVMERLTGNKIDEAQEYIQPWKKWIEERAETSIDKLIKSVQDQKEYAKITRKLIGDLELGDELGEDPTEEDQEDDSNENENEEFSDAEEDESTSDDETQSDDMEADDGTPEEDDSLETEMSEVGEESDNEDDSLAQSARGRGNDNEQRRELPYKIFTEKYDEEIKAVDLCEMEELERLREYLDQQLNHLQGAVTRLANKLQRKLLAQQNRSWEFDLEEGLLDVSKLTRVIIDPTSALSFKMEKDIEFRDTVVSLLIDNSGSMRGRPITIAAMCADILARTLERCSVKTEVLGFTTKAWKGGKSRESWLEEGKQPAPGRLNDLRHIIYKTADEPWRRSKRNLGLMLREGLLKENIDGEALEWAHKRLLGRTEQRKILMVISDGAPVDDSTLSVNAGNYLERHLKQVIQKIELDSSIELTAIGIGHDVNRYYRKAVTIVDAEQLGGAITEQLAGLFDEEFNSRHKKRIKIGV